MDIELTITVRMIPRTSRSEIVGMDDGALRVRIAAAPVDGAANGELVKVLAKAFHVPKGGVEITSAETSKTKRVRLTGAADAAIQAVLRP